MKQSKSSITPASQSSEAAESSGQQLNSNNNNNNNNNGLAENSAKNKRKKLDDEEDYNSASSSGSDYEEDEEDEETEQGKDKSDAKKSSPSHRNQSQSHKEKEKRDSSPDSSNAKKDSSKRRKRRTAWQIERRYECVCQKKYGSASALRTHIKKKHPDKLLSTFFHHSSSLNSIAGQASPSTQASSPQLPRGWPASLASTAATLSTSQTPTLTSDTTTSGVEPEEILSALKQFTKTPPPLPTSPFMKASPLPNIPNLHSIGQALGLNNQSTFNPQPVHPQLFVLSALNYLATANPQLYNQLLPLLSESSPLTSIDSNLLQTLLNLLLNIINGDRTAAINYSSELISSLASLLANMPSNQSTTTQLPTVPTIPAPPSPVQSQPVQVSPRSVGIVNAAANPLIPKPFKLPLPNAINQPATSTSSSSSSPKPSSSSTT